MMHNVSSDHGKLLETYDVLERPVDMQLSKILKMGVTRDLQARDLPPNVRVQSRKNIFGYIAAVQQATGSLRHAMGSMLSDAPWTSSGGSFKLAGAVTLDVYCFAQTRHDREDNFIFLSIGGGWAGFYPNATDRSGVRALAEQFADELGPPVSLHFTNLTPWHQDLSKGVEEHHYVTAGTLDILLRRGVKLGSVDLIYSQAAAYFEFDQLSFLTAAALLLKPSGALVYNHRTESDAELDEMAGSLGMERARRRHLAGMNGTVTAYFPQRDAMSGNFEPAHAAE